MTTEELRLECLRLAQQAGTESATEVVERAKAYSDYVLGADPAAIESKPLGRRAWTDEQTAEAVRLYGTPSWWGRAAAHQNGSEMSAPPLQHRAA